MVNEMIYLWQCVIVKVVEVGMNHGNYLTACSEAHSSHRNQSLRTPLKWQIHGE